MFFYVFIPPFAAFSSKHRSFVDNQNLKTQENITGQVNDFKVENSGIIWDFQYRKFLKTQGNSMLSINIHRVYLKENFVFCL